MPGETRAAAWVWSAVLTGAVLRCWNSSQSFWWDEIWSTMTYVRADSLRQVVSSLGYYFNNHILYSLMARGCISILGEGEFTARLPAILMGLLGIAVLFQFGKGYLGGGCAVIGAFLLALSPFHIDHASEARGYAGLALFSLLSSLYFLEGVRRNRRSSWMCYVVFTVLGYYTHVFMSAVSLSQVCFSLLIILLGRWHLSLPVVAPGALRNFFIALFSGGIITLALYSPIVPAFITNLGKVELGTAQRLPFLLSLADTLLPGLSSAWGALIYGTVLLAGTVCMVRKDVMVFMYVLMLVTVPLTLYLLVNPMFLFERYFIFALPFIILVVSAGVLEVAGMARESYRSAVLVCVLVILLFLQAPALGRILTQDRQNYREAVSYVAGEMQNSPEDLIFSIGYAGEHFRYYAPAGSLYLPRTLDELASLMEGRKHIWCLITAWLPELRPPCADSTLYSERTGQVDIYNYVKEHFVLRKNFPSRYPVKIYFLQR